MTYEERVLVEAKVETNPRKSKGISQEIRKCRSKLLLLGTYIHLLGFSDIIKIEDQFLAENFKFFVSAKLWQIYIHFTLRNKLPLCIKKHI